MQQYHDQEWGVPVRDDQKLFECLILEGAQAGLSWRTVLARRAGYREVFLHWNIAKLAQVSDSFLEAASQDPKIIRHRQKIWSVRTNAQVFLRLQKEFGSFANYLWSWSNAEIIQNFPRKISDLPSTSPLAKKISADLRQRGMYFVGPTIIYAYLQAVGVIDDHLIDCDWKTSKHKK